MFKKYWLIIRSRETREAIGIATWDRSVPWVEYDKPDELNFHSQMDSAVGVGKWIFSTITEAEYETYRDLHGLKVLGN